MTNLKSKNLFLALSLVLNMNIHFLTSKAYAQNDQPDFNAILANVDDAYQNRKFDKVIEAGSFWVQDLRTPRSFEVKFYEFMSRAELEMGKQHQARIQMKKLFRIAPRYRPNRKQLPPAFVKFAESVRTEFWPKQFFYAGIGSNWNDFGSYWYGLGYDKIIKQSPWGVGLNFTRLRHRFKSDSQPEETAKYTLLSLEIKYLLLLPYEYTVYSITGQGIALSLPFDTSDELSGSANEKSYALTLGFGANYDKLLWNLDIFIEARWVYIADHRSRFYDGFILGIKI